MPCMLEVLRGYEILVVAIRTRQHDDRFRVDLTEVPRYNPRPVWMTGLGPRKRAERGIRRVKEDSCCGACEFARLP